MKQSTKGPWIARAHSVQVPNGPMVAIISSKPNVAEEKANAHLIAAAPDLLNLAEELANDTTLADNNYYKMLAKQLIKKAGV